MKFDFDVLIAGAGAAGLTALEELTRAGLSVLCVEARGRIGGRILTLHDPLSAVPAELGAEFVHGRSPDIWKIIDEARLPVVECGEKLVRVGNAGETEEDDSESSIFDLMRHMQAAAKSGPDRSFREFVEPLPYPETRKHWAAAYVEGFNAADQNVIGIASLAKDAEAADQIDGDRSFRMIDGYDSLMQRILSGVKGAATSLRLNSIVEAIDWEPGVATIQMRSALVDSRFSLKARCVLITVPLGVLQAPPESAGAIRFSPPPAALAGVHSLAFGQVFRIVLRFRENFWHKKPRFAGAGFILSRERLFPTWWTSLPVQAPVITGWSSGPRAEPLIGRSRPEIIQNALESLSRITGSKFAAVANLLESAYFHDWHADPFARGAYSYVPAGAMAAREALAAPVDSTLFFAGEATELNGHSATVHGAIASGRRAAHRILSLH